MVHSGSNTKDHLGEGNVKWKLWYFKCRHIAEKLTVSLSPWGTTETVTTQLCLHKELTFMQPL